MFDGMPEQFYQFLAAATSRATATTAATAHVAATLPLSFSLHHAANTFPIQHPPFDASFLLNNNHHPQIPLHLQQQHTRNEAHIKEDAGPTSLLPAQEGCERSSLMLQESNININTNVPWSNQEVLALLKIRSCMDNTWFPPHEFTWENVSRKLGEIGFKRSAEKCKEKFEEETSSFNTSLVINNCINKNNASPISQNYRLFSELEELYNNNNHIDHCNDDDHQSPHAHDDHHDDPEPLLSSQGNKSSDGHNDDDGDGNDARDAEKMGQEKSVANEEGTRNDNRNVMDDDDQQSVDDSEKTEESTKKVGVRKRKRQKKFEMFKGFCEKIVNKMMAQQEEMHRKILQDMVKRDQEKIAREEAWKRQEIERITKEMEVRVHEHSIFGDRQAKFLDFLKKFSSSNNVDQSVLRETLEELMIKVPKPTSFSNNNSSILSQDSMISSQLTSSCSTHDQIPTSLVIPTSSLHENLASQSGIRLNKSNLTQPISSSPLHQPFQNPNLHVSQNESLGASVPTQKPFRSDHTSTNAKDQISKPSVKNVKDDTGRRWPRDEVLALINIRCNLFSNNGDQPDKESSFSKGPLWERISQKMLELGYKRSAKRCKEKWENINKYFRKTKDLNRKRSVDSRTCPYFYQLSHLYSQGAAHGSSGHPTNVVTSPENQPMEVPGGHQGESNNTSNAATTTVHAAAQVNEGNVVQVPGLDFEF